MRRVTRNIALIAVAATAIAPFALAQSEAPLADVAGNLSSQFGISDYLQDTPLPQRTPLKTENPTIEGLPDGVSVDRAEWLDNNRVALFIRSAVMPEELQQVQLLLPRDWYSQPDKTFPELWALDGLRALDTDSGWIINTNIQQQFADRNVLVVLPIGGESSFYSDWQRPDNGKNYKWESFLMNEVVPILQHGYRSTGQRGVVGISMGGTAAMNLAERHPEAFNFVGSFSGYLDTTSPGMPVAIRAAQKDAGGYNTDAMWGPEGSQDWIDHDPKLGVEALMGKTVYVSAGSGKDDFGQENSVAKGPANLAGMGLETIARMTTQTFVDRAKQANVEVIAQFRPSGVHSWEYWQFELNEAWKYIADALALPDTDRSTACTPVGAIAEIANVEAYGTCITDEYDVPGGKAEDFRGGRAYWSANTGAHMLVGRIGALYAEMKATESWLGFPLMEEQATPDGVGRYVHFERGSIYWSPSTGAQAVPKDMVDAWGQEGYELGSLGYPAAPSRPIGDAIEQEFEHGFVIRNHDVAYIVRGEIAKRYKELKGVESPLGAPIGNEKLLDGGAYQEFDKGAMYWSPETGARYILNGPIRDTWGNAGWENGKYGFPAEDQKLIPAGGEIVIFEGGTISQVNGMIVEV